MTPIVLVAHGSRDPRARRATLALAAAVRRHAGVRVTPAFLDFSPPDLGTALAGERARGARSVVVVPALLTTAYHSRVDIPAQLAAARAAGTGVPVRLAEVLGPGTGAADDGLRELMVDALIDRLGPAVVPGDDRGVPDGAGVDAVVLAAAGSRSAGALAQVAGVAVALGRRLAVPCLPGYASGAGQPVAAALELLRARGAGRIAVASYFLAPGRLFDRVAQQARQSGVLTVTQPLGDALEISRIVAARAGAARPVLAAA